ncbi:nicotinate phosphoribosyltransferase [Pseudonocardia acidicola]|uniref:Nicotinate phosphoribosyltransferase n=1 Tax=Pseudonocardia acidicola TaxID=2724939 RepID=A0ABX1SA16_9PSEU|nr:nicotinate phosphoribosyltransferase [Pseudonocardia acidicola]NMH97018.1 nicotinate phosphoribosyltransferase [Pseudonocardia acidicola]
MTPLHTDLSELQMAASYLRRGMTGTATFSLFARAMPADHGFLVAAGLDGCLEFLSGFAVDADERPYLRTELGLPARAARALAGLTFSGDVRAVPEGRIVPAGVPLLEIDAPIAQAQLVGTRLLDTVTFATAVATRAARCRIAAGDADCLDLGARHGHGRDAAMATARARAVTGFAGTGDVAAAQRYGLPAVGTMSHSYVLAFPDERSAFRAFAEDFPDRVVFVVDTYDTVGGVFTAIDVARELALRGPIGVRFGSGDLGPLARRVRTLLDGAGLPEARIVVSGGLDEHAVARLARTGAPIDAYGIGTAPGTSADAEALDTAYTLVEYAGRPVMRLSPGKATAPEAKQVFRGGPGQDDVLGLRRQRPPHGYRALLEPVMVGGIQVAPAEQPAAARERFEADLRRLPEAARRLRGPRPLAIRPSGALVAATMHLRGELATAPAPD